MNKYTYEYQIQGEYPMGWEIVERKDNWKDALKVLLVCRENEPDIAFAIRKARTEEGDPIQEKDIIRDENGDEVEQ
jgi:hypothetical protein